MVVEGRTEEVVLRDILCRHLANRNSSLPVDRIMGVLVPDGGNRIRNKDWVAERVRRPRQGGHDCVLVVADQERHPTPAAVRNRLTTCGADGIFIASPKFERWLLADPAAVLAVLGSQRPNGWLRRDPLDVLEGLKSGYKKVTDGTLIGRASDPVAWATQEPEFCEMLHMIESHLGLNPTPCGRAQRRPAGRRQRVRRKRK